MLKKYFLFLVLLSSFSPIFADHISGGEMSYEYLGPGSISNSGKYRITCKLYRDCFTNSSAQLDAEIYITIFEFGQSSVFKNILTPRINPIDVISLTTPDPCIYNPPQVCYQIGKYETEVELPFTPNGYTISFQRGYRLAGIFNVDNSSNFGVTLTTTIPGTANISTGPINSAPKFNTNDTIVICENEKFKYDFSAKDIDGDILSYAFESAYSGADRPNSPNPKFASPPPYSSVPYSYGFSSNSPLGTNVTIDPLTGVISGIAPAKGIYVITVAVTEKRGNSIINTQRKELHIKVANCSISSAQLKPVYATCDGLTMVFKNESTNSGSTYNWEIDMNDGTIQYLQGSPTAPFVFPKPGDYNVKLITDKGLPCSATATTVAKAYPGFEPLINLVQTCQGVPYTFNDNSLIPSGTYLTSRHWDFGNPQALNDTANTPTSSYTYNSPGTYTVSLVVTNSAGCTKIKTQTIVVTSQPQLNVTNDTLICTKDQLQLLASGTGTFSWSPNYMISNVNIANPIVKPKVPTRYNVTLTQAPGCTNTASVFVDVRDFVSLDAGMDTTICLGDSIRLSPISDALIYTWSPSSTIKNPNSKQAWAKPSGTTRYSVTGSIGTCQATDGFVVSTVPYPKANAGQDTIICSNGLAQLHATGGEKYLWSPASSLDNNTLQNPLASPNQSTFYIVGVYSNNGCPKPGYDTLKVSVMPNILVTATNDTSVVIGEPLQLFVKALFDPKSPNSNEFVRNFSYSWTPSSFLNDPSAWNPIAKINNDTIFYVKAYTNEGCYGTDSVKVKVYKTPPEIFVPTAFTPNDDGLNDQLIPVPVGIATLVYFKVYNRYGELVFSTSEIGKGWNGIHKGRDQGNEYFVWQVLGIDYLGKPFFKKGQTTLIR